MKKHIEIGDYYLITVKNKEIDYDGQIVWLDEHGLVIEWFNQVKGGLCETSIKFAEIVQMVGFNDSQTTV